MFINPKDLKIEFYKSSGPGGQRKNKRQTAVRITHLPSGIVVVATEHRSQARNKDLAMDRLAQRLIQSQQKRKKRIPSQMPQVVRERIRAWKKKHSHKKRLRRKKIDIEGE